MVIVIDVYMVVIIDVYMVDRCDYKSK